MSRHRQLNYGQPLPQDFLDHLQEFISTLLVNFQLTLANPTTVQVVAGSGNAQTSVGIMGRWRHNDVTANAAHPGGAIGQWDVFVTGSDNAFVPGGGSGEIDNTVYAFGLVILAQGATPGTALYRKVAEVTWDGVRITAITMTAGSSPAGTVSSQVNNGRVLVLGF